MIMPAKAPTLCKHPGCGVLVRGGYCDQHQAAAANNRKLGQQDYNRRRAESDRLYSTQRWRKLSIVYKKRHPCAASVSAMVWCVPLRLSITSSLLSLTLNCFGSGATFGRCVMTATTALVKRSGPDSGDGEGGANPSDPEMPRTKG